MRLKVPTAEKDKNQVLRDLKHWKENVVSDLINQGVINLSICHILKMTTQVCPTVEQFINY